MRNGNHLSYADTDLQAQFAQKCVCVGADFFTKLLQTVAVTTATCRCVKQSVSIVTPDIYVL